MGILGDVEHALAEVLANAATDDALRDRQAQAGDRVGPDAGAAIIASARSSVVSMSIEMAKSWVILASSAKAPARSPRSSVESAGWIPAASVAKAL